MSRYHPQRRFTKLIEVERGTSAVEYEVVFEVSPEEPERGPSYSSGGEPGCPASVESKAVYFIGRKTCPACSGTGLTRVEVGESKTSVMCRKCFGKKRIEFREERPELEDLVDDDELLAYAAENGDYDGPDTMAEARGER